MKSDVLIARMVRAVNIAARPFTRELEKKHDISLNAWRCLRCLVTDGDVSSAGVLSDRTGLDKMSTSRALKELEGKKLVSRVRSSEDRRRYCIDVSRKGHELVDILMPDALARADLMLKPLTQAQRKALAQALDCIIEHARSEE
tara:strand:+ start:478 stop:909 length:432 start_codon:yes stop_codon:yes gene_type:complete